MPHLGSLLRKKKTKDREDGPHVSTPTSPVVKESQTTANSNTTTNSSVLSDVTKTTTSHATKDSHGTPITPPASDESTLMLRQSPSSQKPVDANKEQRQQNAVAMQSNNTAATDGTQGNIQPVMAQGVAPANGQHGGIKPMADGSWPVQRDSKATKGKYSLTDFDFRRTLGTGSFGRVHLVKSKHNSRFYAIKVLKKAQVVKMKQVEHTNDERKMLARVKHPFLITLWGTFHDSKNLYMVMDFVEGGELFSLLRKSQVILTELLVNQLLMLTLIPEISQPRRKVLRRGSRIGPRLPTLPEYRISRPETRKPTIRSPWSFEDYRFRLRQGSSRHHMDSLRHTGLSRT